MICFTETPSALVSLQIIVDYKKPNSSWGNHTSAILLLLPAALSSIAFKVFCGGGCGICTVAALKTRHQMMSQNLIILIFTFM